MSRFRSALITVFLFRITLPLQGGEPVVRLHLAFDGSTAGDDGVKPQSFTRASAATRFDAASGKLDHDGV